jgi:hypothetical protein
MGNLETQEIMSVIDQMTDEQKEFTLEFVRQFAQPAKKKTTILRLVPGGPLGGSADLPGCADSGHYAAPSFAVR